MKIISICRCTLYYSGPESHCINDQCYGYCYMGYIEQSHDFAGLFQENTFPNLRVIKQILTLYFVQSIRNIKAYVNNKAKSK